MAILILQDSFELPRRDSSRDGDIEMGMHQADASDNLKDFLKKVLLHTPFSLCTFASCLSYTANSTFPLLINECFAICQVDAIEGLISKLTNLLNKLQVRSSLMTPFILCCFRFFSLLLL